MKRLYIWLLLGSLGMCVSSVFAQTTDSVGISTDPRPGKAFNLERDSTFYNTFDWFGQNTLSPVNMSTPYTDVNATGFSNPFFNNNSELNYLAFGANSDFYPEDGWELIQWGFGVMLDGSTETSVSGHLRGVPILILYNRHTAMLHVFGAYNEFTSQVFQVELRFTKGDKFQNPDPGRDSYVPSSLLSYANPVAQPLDQPTTVTSVKSRFPFPNDKVKFVHAAFPIAYDPCVCKNDVGLRVYFTPINTMDINLYGRLGATSYSPMESYNGGAATFQDFLNAVYTNGDNVVAGAQIDRDAAKMYDDIIQEMNATGKLDVAAGLDVLKAALNVGVSVLDIFVPGAEELVTAGAKVVKGLKVGAKAVSFSSSALKLKKANAPNAPTLSPPAIIRGEITLSGTVTSMPNAQHATEFAAPGSKGSNTLPEANYPMQPYYPLYNEELGVLALLETPVIKRQVSLGYIEPCGGQLDCESQTNETAAYRLAGPIKYAINPAARIDVSKSDISVAIVIKRAVTPGTTLTGLGNLEEGVDPQVYISPFLPAKCIEDLTMYIDRVFQSSIGGQDYNPGTDQVYLRFANTYVSTTTGTNGLPVISQQVVTFPVTVQDVASVPYSARIPFDLTLSGLIGGSRKAWREITITNTATFSGTTTITAGLDVTVNPNVSIPPGVVLQTGLSEIISCGAANEPYTPARLDTFCRSTIYRANVLSRLGRTYVENDVAAQEQARKEQARITLSLHPNPTSGPMTLKVALPEDAAATLQIYDQTGRLVATPFVNRSIKPGPQEIEVDLSGLAVGLYSAVFTTGTQRGTTKVVVQR